MNKSEMRREAVLRALEREATGRCSMSRLAMTAGTGAGPGQSHAVLYLFLGGKVSFEPGRGGVARYVVLAARTPAQVAAAAAEDAPPPPPDPNETKASRHAAKLAKSQEAQARWRQRQQALGRDPDLILRQFRVLVVEGGWTPERFRSTWKERYAGLDPFEVRPDLDRVAPVTA